LSLFVSESDDFLIPLGLYEQRLSRLEAYGKERSFVDVFYKEGNSASDPPLRAYRGRIDSFEQYSSAESLDPRIEGSGYQSITVLWTEDGGEENLSPWELDIIADALDEVSRARLKEEEKRKISRVLASLKEVDVRSQVFFEPVDVSKYSDYENMVELPMDLSFVITRVESDYYASTLSVFSDVKLVCDNCAKYNGSDDDLTDVAQSILRMFSKEVLSIDELHSVDEFEKHAAANVEAWSLQNEDAARSVPARRPHRNQRSELENETVPSRGSRMRARSAAPESGNLTTHRELRRSTRGASNHPARPESSRTRGIRLHNHRRAVEMDHQRRRARESHPSQLEELLPQRATQNSTRPARTSSLRRRGMHVNAEEETHDSQISRSEAVSTANAMPTRRAVRQVAAPMPPRSGSGSARRQNRSDPTSQALNDVRARRFTAQAESVNAVQRRSSRNAPFVRSRAQTGGEPNEEESNASQSDEEETSNRRRLRSSPARSASNGLAQSPGRQRSSRQAASGDSGNDSSTSGDSSAPVASRRAGRRRPPKAVDSEVSTSDGVVEDDGSSSEQQDSGSDSDDVPKRRAAARSRTSVRRAVAEPTTRSNSRARSDGSPETPRRSGRRAVSKGTGVYAEQNESEFTDSDMNEEASPPAPLQKKRKEGQFLRA
jgi:Bromodomain